MTATRDDLISAWRADMLAMPALTDDDVAELEDHLVSQADELRQAGLSDEEALLNLPAPPGGARRRRPRLRADAPRPAVAPARLRRARGQPLLPRLPHRARSRSTS